MFTVKLRQRFWKMFDSWAMTTPPGPRQRPPVKLRLESLEDRLVPALWMVDLTSDSGAGMINPQGGGGQGTLRFCMANAVSGDTIDFGVSGTIALNTTLPFITDNITIDGAGQNVEIWGGGNIGIFNITAGATAEIDNLSIDSGFDNTVGAGGGGAYNNGDLTLKNDTFLGNKATYGGAIYNDSGATLTMSGVSLNNNSATDSGGGIYNLGDLTCEGHCSIVNNKAANGAGVENQGTALLTQGMQITGNQATSLGGGIRVDAGKVTVTGLSGSAAIDYNTAPAGGGIYNASGTLMLTPNVTIENNQATSGNGGGILVGGGTVNMSSGMMTQNSATSGGGIYVEHGSLTLKDDLIKDNSAVGGGGLYNSGGTVKATGGSMEGNSASNSGGGIYANGGSITLNNVVLNDNDADVDGGGLYSYGGTVIVNGGSFTDNSALNNGAGICNDNKGILTLQNGVTFTANKNAKEGGGLYLAIGSTTTFNGCTVKGNFATTGVGVYQQTNAQGTTARVIYGMGGLTDNDDLGGVPFKGP